MIQPTLFPIEIATRTMTRSMDKVKAASDAMRKVDFSIIQIRPGFNWRTKFLPETTTDEDILRLQKIPELADLIYASNGPHDALIGDITPDGIFYITEGERRFRALNYLLHVHGVVDYPNGQPIHEVLVVLNPPGTTELDRKKRMYSSADKMKLTPMQICAAYYDTKVSENMTDDEVGKVFGVSRQKVNQYIAALSLPLDIQYQIDEGKIGVASAVLQYNKGNKDKDKKGLQESMEILDEQSAKVSEFNKQAEKDKYKDGDEDDFSQQDNTKSFAGSMNGPAESSGEAIIGVDSPYKEQQDIATWKQFINRYEVLKQTVTAALLKDDVNVLETTGGNLDGWINDKLIERLRNEYTPPKAK